MRIAIVLPAQNAGVTLKRTADEIDRSIVDDLILVDDASADNTIALAETLGLSVVQHSSIRGYGATQ